MNIKKFCKNNLPEKLVKILRQIYFFAYRKRANPEDVLKKTFKEKIGYQLDLDNPKTFNEKLQWLKLHDHNPIYTTMVDKYAVKQYVANKIGGQYIIPTLGVWEHFDDIDFDKLPNQFVLKCTHDSGSIVVVPDKSKFDKVAAKENLENGLRHNYYYASYEWPYKDVPPKIIIEEYLENVASEGLHDYKIWCFNGEPTYIQYINGRIGKKTEECFFDTNWNMKDFTYHNPPLKYGVKKPKCLSEMLKFAKIFAKDIPFIRVDFYVLTDESIKFGELTFYPMSGLEKFHPINVDEALGSMIHLLRR